MPHILYDVVGDDLILIILEELKDKKISSSEAFEKIREILQINFELSSAKKNVHNSVLIAALIAAKLFPSYLLNSALLKKLSRQEFYFTEDNNFGERITKSGECISCTVDDEFPSSMTIGCVRLLFKIRYVTSDSNLKVVIDKLDKYIDSTGDRIKPQEFWEE